MKHTKSEILNALHVIKDTCYEKYEERDAQMKENNQDLNILKLHLELDME